MAEISFRKVNKIYDGGVHAIHDLSLEISDRDFVVLVGPSGCGKSTLLRMVAGLEEVSFGEVRINGEIVNELPPKERHIAMVFQNYALFPHMTVYENIAFGLKLAKMDKAEIKKRVDEAATILGISNLLSRKPAQLSGGQKQRVALGRAIVCKPQIFLFDEPLSNLDAKLRASMRSELIKLHRKVEATFIYVTHDQTEALTMGTRIAVLKDGYLQQVDSPSQIYEHPANRFVATFMGSPQMNLFSVTLEKRAGALIARFPQGGELELNKTAALRVNEKYLGKEVILGIRPEHLTVTDKAGKDVIKARTEVCETLGSGVILNVSADGAIDAVNALLTGRETYAVGQEVYLKAHLDSCHLFDKETGRALFYAPVCNEVPATLTEEDGKLAVNYAGKTLLLDKYDYLLDDAYLGGEVTLALPSSKPLGQTAEEGCPVRVTVTNVMKQISHSVVWSVLEGTKIPFVFETDGEYEEGKSYGLLLDETKVSLLKDGERILSKRPVRGRFRTFAAGRVPKQKLAILDSETIGNRHLLYCGKAEDYCAVWVADDFPVYFKETVAVEALAGEMK